MITFVLILDIRANGSEAEITQGGRAQSKDHDLLITNRNY